VFSTDGQLERLKLRPDDDRLLPDYWRCCWRAAMTERHRALARCARRWRAG
jgi:hypothetical protein